MIDYFLRAAYICGVRGPRLAYLSLCTLVLTFSAATAAEPVTTEVSGIHEPSSKLAFDILRA